VIVYVFPDAVEAVVVWKRGGKRRAGGSGIETGGPSAFLVGLLCILS
jgi:hypothetical protein